MSSTPPSDSANVLAVEPETGIAESVAGKAARMTVVGMGTRVISVFGAEVIVGANEADGVEVYEGVPSAA